MMVEMNDWHSHVTRMRHLHPCPCLLSHAETNAGISSLAIPVGSEGRTNIYCVQAPAPRRA